MFGLPFLRMRWLLAAAVIAGGWSYYHDHAGMRASSPRKQERHVARSPAVLPARVAVPEKRPSRNTPSRSADLVTAAIPKAPIPASRERAIARGTAPVAMPFPGKPPVPGGKQVPQRAVAAAPAGAPLRKPQEGDCQCPYDLMIDGSACGERSAFARQGRPRSACYR